MRHNPLGISLRRYLTEAKVTRQEANDKIKTRFSQSNHARDHGFFKLDSLTLHQTSQRFASDSPR